MEDRSSRRMRTLVTHLAGRGLSLNQIACALISMMARSTTRSKQRPDTLMQDRSPPYRRNLLATRGRTSAARLAAIPAGGSPANRDAMGRAARTMAPSSL